MPRVYGTDWGSYLYYDQRIQFDWDILVNAGCKFFITRGDQEELSDYGNYSTVRNIAAARASGVPVVGSYYWHYPHLQQGYWIDRYIKAIAREHPDVIAVDAEQTSYIGDDGKSYPVDKARAAATLIELCSALRKTYPDIPFLLYSRRDYLLNYTAAALPYINTCDLWLAGWPDYGLNVYEQSLADTIAGKMRAVTNYAYTPLPWVTVDANNWTAPTVGTAKTLIWQHSSRIIPTYDGKTTPAYHQYDHNLWLGSETELLAWAKKQGEVIPPPPPVIPPEEANMASIHNINTPQKQRAKIVTVEADQKPSSWDLGADAVILPCGEMYYDKAAGKCVVRHEATFSRRSLEAACVVPVFARFKLDSGAWLKGQLTSFEAEKPLKENIVTKALIDGLHSGAWTWDKILTGKATWNKFSAIVLQLTETDGWPTGTLVSDNWQTRIVKTITDHIAYLQDAGHMPKVPVLIYTGMWFLDMYPGGELELWLHNRKDWLYLMLGEWTLYSTATFMTLAEIFAYPPGDDFEFTGGTPDGYFERILAHEFSSQYQKVKTITDADGIPTPVSLALWCDTKAVMYQFLGITDTQPPVEPPPVEPPVTPPPVDKTEAIRTEIIKAADALASAAVALNNIADLLE